MRRTDHKDLIIELYYRLVRELGNHAKAVIYLAMIAGMEEEDVQPELD